jgi:hypothetical protein
MPGVQFLRNVLVFSLAGLLPVLALYVALSPGFAPALMEGGPSFRRFARQVMTNGLPVVFVVNYVGFFLFALSRRTSAKERDPSVYLVLDLIGRLTLFVGIHAVIYVLSADWFGSFGGSRTTALRVVGPTLAQSALFQNISGVYLYATLVSALPLYPSVIGRSRRLRPLAALVPLGMGAALLSVCWFLLAVALLTAGAKFLVVLQS